MIVILGQEDGIKLSFASNDIFLEPNTTLESVMNSLVEKYHGTSLEDELMPLFEEAIIRNQSVLGGRELQSIFDPNDNFVTLQQWIEIRDFIRSLTKQ